MSEKQFLRESFPHEDFLKALLLEVCLLHCNVKTILNSCVLSICVGVGSTARAMLKCVSYILNQHKSTTILLILLSCGL